MGRRAQLLERSALKDCMVHFVQYVPSSPFFPIALGRFNFYYQKKNGTNFERTVIVQQKNTLNKVEHFILATFS